MSQTETKEMIRIMKDPVLWAEKHLNQKPRWYQEQILRHPHNRIVLRCGRRLGKCIAGDQRILNAQTGEYEMIDDLYKKRSKKLPVFSVTDDYKIGASSAFHIEDNGIKPVFNVKTKHGAVIKLTGNHPLLTIDGWKEVDMLSVGDFIAKPKTLPVFGKERPGLNRAKVVGYITGGYNMTKAGPILKISTPEFTESISHTAKQENVTLVRKTAQNFFFFDDSGRYKEVLSTPPGRIPKEVFTYDKTHLAVFLASFYDVNGWSYAERIAEIGFGSRSNELAREMKHLLLRFGIEANVIQRKISGEPYYQLMIYSKNDVLLFAEEIGKYGLKDYQKVITRAEQMDPRELTIPVDIWPYIEEERQKKKMKKFEVTGNKGEKLRTKIGLSEEKAYRYAENLQFPLLHDLATSDVLWEEITAIEPAGEQQTYDVFVPDTHNLVIEDVLVHNTWTMAAHMLWGVFTGYGGTVKNRGAVAIVATPYDSQAKLIFDQLREFIDNNEMLANSVKSITKNPYYIQFKNGGTIKLFTAGTKNGSGGAGLRGQKADYLYMDKNFVPLRCEAHRITV